MCATPAEELLLLAFDMRGRARLRWDMLDRAVAGALLSQLRLAGRVTLGDDGEIVIMDPAPTGETEADALLARLTPECSPTDVIGRCPGVAERMLARMADRGRVEIERHRSEVRYPARYLVSLWDVQERLVACVTVRSSRRPPTLAVGALVVAAGLGKAVFSAAGDWRGMTAVIRDLTAGTTWPKRSPRRSAPFRNRLSVPDWDTVCLWTVTGPQAAGTPNL